TVQAVEKLGDLIKSQTNIKEIKLQETMLGIKQSVKADFAQIGPDFGSLAPKIITKLSLESPETILHHVENEKAYKLNIDGKKVEIVKEHLVIKREVPSPFIENEFKNGFVYLNQERTEELEAEGYAREVMRRIQSLRKQAGLNKADKIILFIKVDEDIKDMLSNWEKQIQEKVGALKIRISEQKPGKKHKYSSKEKVKGIEFELFFDKVQ
ncbi:MAG: hypothetical protein KAU20_00100, partial [Nanoarchaeota archaeon]|nr:hypothetical protein [Nanoarchaeota archaeon]